MRWVVLAMLASTHARAEPKFVAAGFTLFDSGSYIGKYESFSDTKIDFRARAVGLRGELGARPSKYFFASLRLDLLYRYGLKDEAYTPDSMQELRIAAAFGGAIPTTTGAVRIGLSIGLTAGRITAGSATEYAKGATVALLVGGMSWRWAPWGWFFDFEPLGAGRNEGGYDTDVLWLARTSVGVVYAW